MMGPKGEGWHDEPINPEQKHEPGSFAETMSDVIPTSAETEAQIAEKAAKTEQNKKERAAAVAALGAEAKEAAGQ